MRGTITMVLDEKGFGYITGEDGCDYFFHRRSLRGLWFDAQALQGLLVSFEILRGSRGAFSHAVKVRVSGEVNYGRFKASMQRRSPVYLPACRNPASCADAC
jgi:CspA family cold shock protein